MADTLKVSEIVVEDRQRKEMGDIDALARSIGRVGLIQPIVVDGSNRLVAGERRLRACQKLKLEEVPIVRKGELTEDVLSEMELEENVRRKDMEWKERVRGIVKVHRLRVNRKALESDKWTQEMTGELMGMSKSNVSYCIQIANELNDPESQIHKCDSFTDAIRWMAQARIDALEDELASRTKDAMHSVEVGEEVKPALPIPDTEQKGREGPLTVPLSKMLIHGDCLHVLKSMPNGAVDHCITDPPYAIDMDMLEQENTGVDVSRVRAEHDVESNKKLLSSVIPLLVRVVKPTGYIVMWCDIMNWQFLHDELSRNGLKVQRWPFVWHKLHQCMNQAARYNFTKDVEMCIIARHPGAALSEGSQTSMVAARKDQTDSNLFAKPWEVWDPLVKAITFPGQTIIDPFCGEGSSLESFISSWRVFVGIEINEKHYNVALNRVKERLDLLYRKPKYV